MPCKKCKSNSVSRDEDTGRLICLSCGEVQEFDNFEVQAFNRDGPLGVYVRVGTSGIGSSLTYKDKKIYEANKLIDEVCLKLNLTGAKPSELKSMVRQITDGEFGHGDWLLVLICACAYIIMRGGNKPVPIQEIANVAQCGKYDLGRMVARVVKFLDVELPAFDLVGSFERVLSKLSEFGKIRNDQIARVREQGVFLINCAVKWFLSTGRRPLPLVVAVLVFVAELNGLPDIRIHEVCKDFGIAVATGKRRYKELLERLVEVAKVLLPWGNDVTVKNVVKYGALLLKHMEMKSTASKRGGEDEADEIDLKKAVSKCLREDHYDGGREVDESLSKYFYPPDDPEEDESQEENIEDKVTPLLTFPSSADANPCKNLTELQTNGGRTKRPASDLYVTDGWNGNSTLSKKIMLEQILEADIGLDAMPPSFVSGCENVEQRRAKIRKAKARMERHVRPLNNSNGDKCRSDSSRKKRKKKMTGKDFDCEDLIIETLLLHGVSEEQIESGHYRALLDLHVFNSGDM